MIKTSIILFCIFILFGTFLGAEEPGQKSSLQGDLIAAQLYCFSLEDFLFTVKDNYKSKDDVVKFFKQGFGPVISEKLTENIWNNNQVELKSGDKIMESPDNVFFTNITDNSAMISFKTPKNRKNIWGNSEFTELVFQKEDGRWKLFQIQ